MDLYYFTADKQTRKTALHQAFRLEQPIGAVNFVDKLLAREQVVLNPGSTAPWPDTRPIASSSNARWALSRCCKFDAGLQLKSCGGDDFAPRLHRRGPKGSMRSCRCEMTLDVEGVVDCRMH
jgi:hypothetical protein